MPLLKNNINDFKKLNEDILVEIINDYDNEEIMNIALKYIKLNNIS